MTAVLANVTIDYSTDGNVAFTPKQMAEVGFDPEPLGPAKTMILVTQISSALLNVQYSAPVAAGALTPGDFFSNKTGFGSPSIISQVSADTIQLSGWSGTMLIANQLIYSGNAVGISTPQTITIT